MRLPERYKQDVYISSETYYGSDIYTTPTKIRGIVSPRTFNLLVGGGILQEQTTAVLQIESNIQEAKHITENTHIWIKQAPDPNKYNADYTHVVVGREPSTTNWYVTIQLKSTAGDTPIV